MASFIGAGMIRISPKCAGAGQGLRARRVGPARGATYYRHETRRRDATQERDMGQFGMGQPVRRVEDKRFRTGTGQYTDNTPLPKQTTGVVLPSTQAHA